MDIRSTYNANEFLAYYVKQVNFDYREDLTSSSDNALGEIKHKEVLYYFYIVSSFHVHSKTILVRIISTVCVPP